MNKFLILINWSDHAFLHIHQKSWYIAGFCVCRYGSGGGDEELLISCLCGCQVKKRTALLEAALSAACRAMQQHCSITVCVSVRIAKCHALTSLHELHLTVAVLLSIKTGHCCPQECVLFDFILVFVAHNGVFGLLLLTVGTFVKNGDILMISLALPIIPW